RRAGDRIDEVVAAQLQEAAIVEALLADEDRLHRRLHIVVDAAPASALEQGEGCSPQYCRATPTECCPFLGKLVSSMIHASIGPWRSNSGSTSSRTFARTFSSDHPPSPIKCSSD